jgi:hypothetical protein
VNGGVRCVGRHWGSQSQTRGSQHGRTMGDQAGLGHSDQSSQDDEFEHFEVWIGVWFGKKRSELVVNDSKANGR